MLLSKEVRALTEVGFLASARGDVKSAYTIFNLLIRLRPHRAFPYIGLAVAYLNADRAADAVAVFESAAQVDENERADMLMYQALTLQAAARFGESWRLLAELNLDCASPEISRLVTALGVGNLPINRLAAGISGVVR